MFDKIAFLQFSALLKSFKQYIPPGDVEEALIDDYHSYLDNLQDLIGADLYNFQVPSSSIKTRGGVPYCDSRVLNRQVDAVLMFIDSYMPEIKAQVEATRSKTVEKSVPKEEVTIKIEPPE